MDITGSFLHSSEDEDQDGEIQKATEGPDSPSFQVLDGLVLVTLSKAFQSDTSEGQTSDSSLSDEEPDDSDNETKYGCHLCATFVYDVVNFLSQDIFNFPLFQLY